MFICWTSYLYQWVMVTPYQKTCFRISEYSEDGRINDMLKLFRCGGKKKRQGMGTYPKKEINKRRYQ